MAVLKISQLSEATTVADTDLLEISQDNGIGYDSKKITKKTLQSSVTGSAMSTGVLSYTGMTVASSNTVAIPAVIGQIISNTGANSSNPIIYNVSYAGNPSWTPTYLLTHDATYVLLDNASNLYTTNTEPTAVERRNYIFIGKIAHPSHSTILNINNLCDHIQSPMSTLRDMFSSMRLINNGCYVSPNGANLTVNLSSGALFGTGINFASSPTDPNQIDISSASPKSFYYRTQFGGATGLVSSIDPSQWDFGGEITPIDGNTNRSTNQYVYLYPTGVINIQYGQRVYNSLALALAGQQTESFIRCPNVATTAILIGILAIRRTTADLSNRNYAVFTPASMFGENIGGVNGISTTTLQQSYNNSTTPEIVTDDTRGAVTLKRGSGADTDNVLEVLNGAGDTKATVNGNGLATVHDVFISNLNRNFTTLGTDTRMATGVPWTERSKLKCTAVYNSVTDKIDVNLLFTDAVPFSYYINDKKYTISTLPDIYTASATPAEGTWFVYINQSNVFTVTQTPWNIYDPDVLLWNFYYSAVIKSVRWIGEERHTAGRDIYQHARNHYQGAIYKSGLLASVYNGLSTFTANNDNNFGRAYLQIASGAFFDEDIQNSIFSDSDSATLNSTDTSPSTDWNLNVKQYLGFTDIAAVGTNATTLVFPFARTLKTGHPITVMAGNTTTIRATVTINTGATGTSFAVTVITGGSMTSGDAIVVGAQIPMYYIDNVSGSTYRWRDIASSPFLGVIQASALSWSRTGTTVTVTSATHGYITGDVISVTVTSNATAVPLNNYSITYVGLNTFTITGIDSGGTTGTLTYVAPYATGNIASKIAQYNLPAGGLSAITSGRFFPVYLMATNKTSEPIIAILGQGFSSSTTLSTALNETPWQFQNVVGLAGLGIQETVPFYRITYEYNSTGGFNESRLRIRDVTYINVRVSTSSGVVIGGSSSTAAASQVFNNTSAFNGVLTTSETTVQAALDRIDDVLAYTSVKFEVGDGVTTITGNPESWVRAPFSCTIVSATLMADASCSAVIDIWKDSFANFPPLVADSICGSAKPTLSSATTSEDTTLIGWTPSIVAGEVLKFHVDSSSNAKKITLELKLLRT